MLELSRTLFENVEFGTDFVFIFFTFIILLEVLSTVVDLSRGVIK